MRKGGEVAYVEILTNSDKKSKGCAIVEYTNMNDARNAIQTLNNTSLHGRDIFIREDREPKGKHMK